MPGPSPYGKINKHEDLRSLGRAVGCLHWPLLAGIGPGEHERLLRAGKAGGKGGGSRFESVRLNKAAAEIATDGTCTDKHELHYPLRSHQTDLP
jgi:hypothetical protein